MDQLLDTTPTSDAPSEILLEQALQFLKTFVPRNSELDNNSFNRLVEEIQSMQEWFSLGGEHPADDLRQWLKDLGVKMVHINPYYDHTAALMGGKWLAPRPDTGNAMSLAIAYVWITEDLYDKEYVASRTTGFDKWKDYILGKEDGIPKTPEWQEKETTVPFIFLEYP